MPCQAVQIGGGGVNVLIACEESQAVCKAFRERGHNAYSCDLVECSGGHLEWHIQGDVRLYLNPRRGMGQCDELVYEITFRTMDGRWHTIDSWDLIIAHPPCTYMSKAGARWMYPKAGQISQERLEKAMRAKGFFEYILKAECPRICIENPTPLKVVGLPKPTQVIQPYQFGHPFSKATCLWLKGLQPLQPTEILTEYRPFCPSNTGGVSRGQHYNKGGCKRGDDDVNRSKTFDGIARAMAEQWSNNESEVKNESISGL